MPDPYATADDFLYTLLFALLVFLFGKIRNAIKRGSTKPIERNDRYAGLESEQTEAKTEKVFKEETKSVEPIEKVNELDSESSKAAQTSAKLIPEPEIVTRTSINSTGKPLLDRFFGIEREFTNAEDKLLLEHYREGLGIVAIANTMRIDQKQVAIRLIRILVDPQGPMNDEENASENGHNYRSGEKEQIEKEFLSGTPIEEIATLHNRTVLAIGWQLLERPSKPLLKIFPQNGLSKTLVWSTGKGEHNHGVTLQIRADGTTQELIAEITPKFLEKAVGGPAEAIEFSHYWMWVNSEMSPVSLPRNQIATFIYQAAYDNEEWVAGDVILTHGPNSKGELLGLSQMDSEILFPYVEAIQQEVLKTNRSEDKGSPSPN